jgi:hypothetical protein
VMQPNNLEIFLSTIPTPSSADFKGTVASELFGPFWYV